MRMESVKISTVATPDLNEPVLVEGLPGVGLVGSLAANYLVKELESTPVRKIYSQYFPPILPVSPDGTAELEANTMYAVKAEEQDLLVMTGYCQADDQVGQYIVTDAVLDIAAGFEVKEVLTLGGAVAGEQFEDYKAVGAVAKGSTELKNRLEDTGVSFGGEDSPRNIGGISGLLLGLSRQRGLSAGSILATTSSSHHPDPKSAKVVLNVLYKLFDITNKLSSTDEIMDDIINEFAKKNNHPFKLEPVDEEYRYLG